MSRSPLKTPRRGRRVGFRRPLDEPEALLLATALLAAALALFCARAATADAAGSRPATPRLASPANGTQGDALPSFAWRRSSGAATYEFQLSADPAFESLVGGQAGGYQTLNTFATVDKAAPDGTYYWRVRAIDKAKRTGRWSPVRRLVKSWSSAPQPQSPANGAAVTYPATPLVLRWSPVPRAYKYVVNVATDPSMAHSVLGTAGQGVETSGTVFAPSAPLAPGRYYWSVTPLDAQKHPGTRSPVSSFDWSWPTRSTARVSDLFTTGDPENRVMDPQFSWDPIPGAASYQVEVNPSEDWAVGSKVCCDEAATGASLSPLALLPNNTYFWRVRAVDADGNAGDWNVGPTFKKGFDDVSAPLATVTGLRVRDNASDQQLPTGASGLPTTDSPIVRWDPVPGASSYEVRIAPWEGFCNWTATDFTRPRAVTVTTATTAWTPLGPATLARPVGNASGTPTTDSGWSLWDKADTNYCVRVRARSDRDAKFGEIVSDWTQIGGVGEPAFTYTSRFPSGCTGASTKLAMPPSAYHEPQSGSFTPRMPLFTWDRVPGACGYFVVVARDAEFTKIVDVALTNAPAYAPRGPSGPISYTDETTSYYWAVMPTRDTNGNGLSTQPQEDAPQSFQKRSAPPVLLSPGQGTDVMDQPSFRWTGSEGALDYRIQVDDDPTFGSPIDDVKTHSTGFTSTKTYPADTVLYWRVRADAENGFSAVGLNWSGTGSFRRRLAIPAPAADNPQGGETIPMLSWAPVSGAISYDMHVEQVDGTKKDFTMRSAAFTPTTFFGTGVWRWQVRASFRSGFANVAGGYSSLVPFTRHIATPTGLKTAKDNGGALLSWQPASMAKQYKVQISTSDSFSTVIDQATVDGTSFAPRMTQPQYTAPGPLYWRVAVLDEGGNAGGWAMAPLRSPLPLRVRVSGTLRRGRAGTLRIKVTDTRGRALNGAALKASATGMTTRTKRTGRRGTATLRLRPRSKGRVALEVSLRSYTTRTLSLRVMLNSSPPRLARSSPLRVSPARDQAARMPFECAKLAAASRFGTPILR